MKNLKRFTLGVLSSLLFALGFARTADRLDPISRSLERLETAQVGAPDCNTICDVANDFS